LSYTRSRLKTLAYIMCHSAPRQAKPPLTISDGARQCPPGQPAAETIGRLELI